MSLREWWRVALIRERAHFAMLAVCVWPPLGACAPSSQTDPQVAPGDEGSASPTVEVPAASADAHDVITLPIAENTTDLLEGVPNVAVRGDSVFVNDQLVADVRPIMEGGRLRRVDGLFQKLKSMRDEWKHRNPGRVFPGVILHRFDQDLSAVVVKSVFQTAAYAGYPNGSFAVRMPDNPGRVARLPANALVPGPPRSTESSPPTPEKTLFVDLETPQEFILKWKQGADVVRTVKVPHKAAFFRLAGYEYDYVRLPKLAEAVVAEWSAHGSHRTADDQVFDQAVVHVTNEEPYKLIVAIIDAVCEPKRDYHFEGPMRKVPAFNVIFALAANSSRMRSGQPKATGRIAPTKIQAIVRDGYGVFRKCYEAGLARDPNLEGRVTVRFVIGRDGKVIASKEQDPTLPDDEVVQCVVEGFKTLVFPAPEGGIVTVVYPIMFSPER